MNEISSFPAIPKLPYPEAFVLPKNKRSKIDKAMDKLAKFADSEQLKSAHFMGEITSNAFSNVSSLVPKGTTKAVAESASHSANIAGTFADVLGILRGLESVAIIVQNLKKKGVKGIEKTISRLEVVQAFVDIIGAVGSFLGIFDRFKVFELAKITEAMGKIPTIGQTLSVAFPATVVFSLFSIVSSEFTIIISGLKIKKIVPNVQKAKQKIKVKWNQPIDATFSKNQVNKIAVKQETCVQNALAIKAELEKKEEHLNAKKEAYQTLKKEIETSNKVSKKCKKWFAKCAYKKEIKKYQKTHNQLQTLEKTHKVKGEKLLKWQAIGDKLEAGTITEDEKEALGTMQAAKVKKWKAKKVNQYWDIAHEVAKIALAVLAIAVSVTSIGLVIAFTGNLPAAALIAMGTIGLSMAAIHLARSLFFNRIKKKIKSVEVPDFRTLYA